MKKIFTLFIVLCSFSVSAKFIHPIDFTGSEEQKNEVISYIKARVNKDYCRTVDMCQEMMLRMMETENLEAFKRLTQAQDRKILDGVIQDYCKTVDMCTYQMLDMMYNENVKAKSQELKW